MGGDVVIAPVLVIEPMAARHIDVIRAIDARCYSSPWGVATWRNELAEKSRHHVVARREDEILGHAGILIILDEVHVTTVAIHPDHQSGGLATQLVLHLLDHARSIGGASATLEVRASARRTQRLYARFGFQPAGARKSYYSAPVDDAIVMWLHDLQNLGVGQRLDLIRHEIGATAEGDLS
jgi:ribosomal-protein-alanine N-acetyltransferase